MKKPAKLKRLPPFTALPQDLLDALVQNRLFNEPARVLLAIYRLTLGYGRRSIRVPYSKIGAMTGIKKWNIPRAVKLLRENGLIMVVKPDYHKGVVKSDYRKGQEYSPVKDPRKWKNEIPAEFAEMIKNNGSQKRLPSVVKSDYHSAPKPLSVHRPGTPKENLKENLLKKERIYVLFEEFWSIFPKPEKRGAARKEWERIHPDAALWEKIKTTLEWQSQQKDWRKDGGRWIPQPDKWLKDERWEDKPPKGGGNGRIADPGSHDYDQEREAAMETDEPEETLQERYQRQVLALAALPKGHKHRELISKNICTIKQEAFQQQVQLQEVAE